MLAIIVVVAAIAMPILRDQRIQTPPAAGNYLVDDGEFGFGHACRASGYVRRLWEHELHELKRISRMKREIANAELFISILL